MTVQVALEASQGRGSVAACTRARAGSQSSMQEAALAGNRASDLLPLLEGQLEQLGAATRDIDLIVVGLGPGSYTGLRVVASTALGLAHATGAALIGVPSFEALAFAGLVPGEHGFVTLDARAERFYAGRYALAEAGLIELAAPQALAPEAARAMHESGDVVLASAADMQTLSLDPEHRRDPVSPCAAALLELGLRAFEAHGPTDPRMLEPLYLRPFVARKRS